jgi:exopolysaccharide production protein ExoQ
MRAFDGRDHGATVLTAHRIPDLPRFETRARTHLTTRAVVALIDQCVLALFLLYAVHVVISPVDSQVAVEQHVMKIMNYGQLIDGTYGQLFFLFYVAVRTLFFPAIYYALLSPLGGLAIFAMLSALWSIDPLTTLHRALDLLLCVLMPAILVRGLGFTGCVRATWIILSAILVVSVVLALAGVDYALMKGEHLGLWRGLFDHKNSFAPFAAMLAILSFMAPASITGFRWLGLAVAAMAVAAVAFAGSATTYVALTVGALAIFQNMLCHRLNLSNIASFLIMAGSLVIGAALALGAAATVLEMLGRSITLTGRTGLWAGALPFTFTHPIGYGYGMSGGDEVMNAARIAGRWFVAPSLHSGYITLAVDLGWLAVAVFFLFLLSKIVIQGRRASATDPYMLMLAGFAALNLSLAATESPFGAYLSGPLVMIVMIGEATRSERQRIGLRMRGG